jgi:hypothetical protein
VIIVKLMGGNGNQMFQYAAGLALAKRHNVELLLDIFYLLDQSRRCFRHTNRDYALDIFNISGRVANEADVSQFTTPRTGNKYIYHMKKKLLKENNVFREAELNSSLDFFSLPTSCYLEGYWEAPRYFFDIKEILREEFTFKHALPHKCRYVRNDIKSGNSVCVIFRRGDFVGHPVLDIVEVDFYYSAIKLLTKRTHNPVLFVFSDDIPWCENNFKPQGIEYRFVDQSLTGPKAEHYFQMIVECNHFIIPNSTFGWWGAWLGKSAEKIVIAPKIWFKGQKESINSVVPDNWLTL